MMNFEARVKAVKIQLLKNGGFSSNQDARRMAVQIVKAQIAREAK